MQSAIAYARTHNFDGIDLDWEYPSSADKENFSKLLKAMRAAVDAEVPPAGKSKLLLAIAAPAGPYYYNNMDLTVVGQTLDFVNLMTYDLHGPWGGETKVHVHTPVKDCTVAGAIDIDGAVAHYLSFMPADKINLGLATYGKSFTLADGETQTAPGVGNAKLSGGSAVAGAAGACSKAAGTLSWYEIEWAIPAANVKYDTKMMAAYGTYGSSSWVGFDDKTTHNLKICWARHKALGGLMVWDGEMDDSLELIKNINSQRSADFTALCGVSQANYQPPVC